MEKIREACAARGSKGIIGLSRTFRSMDDNRDRKLHMEELKEGLEEFGVALDDNELREVFESFDRDENGTIIFDEFLIGIRPPMSDVRSEIINTAFNKMDQTGEGIVTIEDLRGVYSAAEHPKFLSGEMTEEQVFEKFLGNFDCPNNPDGKITKEDFLNYYAGVSSSIDEDEYFETMMTKAWQL